MSSAPRAISADTRRSLLCSLAFAALCGGIWFFGSDPARAALKRLGGEYETLEATERRIAIDLNRSAGISNRLAAAAADMAVWRSHFLEPLLESYAMRAKTLLEPLAREAGLVDLDFTEEPFRALPVGKVLPRQLHTRAAVRMSATGSYQAAVSLLLKIERDLPWVAVRQLNIATRRDPKAQSLAIIFEWPARGKVTTAK